jgi:hypothetical protein
VIGERSKVRCGPTRRKSDTSRQRESTDLQSAQQHVDSPVTGIGRRNDHEREEPDRQCPSRRNAPTGLLVATVAFIVGTGAFCVWTGAAVFYQAKPGPRSLAGRSLVWAPPLVMRVATVVIVVSLGTITAAVATLGLRPIVLLVLGLPSSPWRSSPQDSSSRDLWRITGESRVRTP